MPSQNNERSHAASTTEPTPIHLRYLPFVILANVVCFGIEFLIVREILNLTPQWLNTTWTFTFFLVVVLTGVYILMGATNAQPFLICAGYFGSLMIVGFIVALSDIPHNIKTVSEIDSPPYTLELQTRETVLNSETNEWSDIHVRVWQKWEPIPGVLLQTKLYDVSLQTEPTLEQIERRRFGLETLYYDPINGNGEPEITELQVRPYLFF